METEGLLGPPSLDESGAVRAREYNTASPYTFVCIPLACHGGCAACAFLWHSDRQDPEKLSSEQKKSLSNAVTEKLQGIIGGYGELGVLVEYISVMLQSSRPKETIQSELEAFLQDESGPFTTWLCENLAKMTEGSTGKRRRKKDPKDPKDLQLLYLKRSMGCASRALQHFKSTLSNHRMETKEVKDSTDAARKAKKEKKAAAAAAANAAAAAAAAAAAPVAAPAERRSRSRKRRRRAAAAEATTATAQGTAATLTAADRKAKLTPNVEAWLSSGPLQKYHDLCHKNDEDYIQEPRKDGPNATRWSFRAETPQRNFSARPEPGAPVPAYVPPSYPSGPPGYPTSRPPFTPAPHAPYGAPHLSHAPPMVHPHGQPYFTPKKWKEKLDSDEVQKLQEGEIVEQVAPSFTTENGIVRVQIRHPSSPLFPKPIGWVTQDASAAGGPKFLEPGPEPMKTPGPPAVSGSSWRPSYWRPPRAPPPRPYGVRSFQHLTWTPSGPLSAVRADEALNLRPRCVRRSYPEISWSQVAASAVLVGFAYARASFARQDEKKDDWREFRARLVEQEKGVTKAGSTAEDTWLHGAKLLEKGSVLISHPGDHYSLDQQYFHKAVILIIKSDAGGDVGVILNRPTSWGIEDFGEPSSTFEAVELHLRRLLGLTIEERPWKVSYGGPMCFEPGPRGDATLMCLHRSDRRDGRLKEGEEILNGLVLLPYNYARELVAMGQAQQEDFHLLSGYCGWAPGQLQEEVRNGGWQLLCAGSKARSSQVKGEFQGILVSN
eukprot:s269_g17.t1